MFKKVHSDAFVKKGISYVNIKHDLNFEDGFKKFKKDDNSIKLNMVMKQLMLLMCCQCAYGSINCRNNNRD